MFTGNIHELGTVRALVMQQEKPLLIISAQKILTDMRVGDSIAVNGVSLLVTEYTRNDFTGELMPESFSKTSLHHLKAGDYVNLEPALAVGARLSGHFVSGQVDGVGRIVEKYSETNTEFYRFSAPFAVLQYLIPKGSIAIDGVSVTVSEVREDTFSVYLLSQTAAATTLGYKKIKDLVNLESDMIGKYLVRALTVALEAKHNDELTIELVKTNGYLQ